MRKFSFGIVFINVLEVITILTGEGEAQTNDRLHPPPPEIVSDVLPLAFPDMYVWFSLQNVSSIAGTKGVAPFRTRKKIGIH